MLRKAAFEPSGEKTGEVLAPSYPGTWNETGLGVSSSWNVDSSM